MGQRSQMYVSFDNGSRDRIGIITNSGETVLTAVYFQWNYGERMVSRARGLVEWLLGNRDYLNYEADKIRKVCEVNFDYKSIMDSTDLVEEAKKYCAKKADRNEWIFGADNNDGRFFVKVGNDGKLKYAFTDCDNTAPLTAEQYLEWDCETVKVSEEDLKKSNFEENCKYIAENAELMTADELLAFIDGNYANV